MAFRVLSCRSFWGFFPGFGPPSLSRLSHDVFNPGLLLGDQALHELRPFLLGGLDPFVQEPAAQLGCTIQVLPVLVAPSEAPRPQSNPMLFVQPCCTNSGLRRTRRLPERVLNET